MISINGCVLTKLLFTTALDQKKSRQVTVVSINAISSMSNAPSAVVVPVPKGSTMRLHKSPSMPSRCQFKKIAIKTYTQVKHLLPHDKYDTTWQFIVAYLEQGIQQYVPLVYSHAVLSSSSIVYLGALGTRANAVINIINGTHTTMDNHATTIEQKPPVPFRISEFAMAPMKHILTLTFKGKVPDTEILASVS